MKALETNWRTELKGWWLVGWAVALYGLAGAAELYTSQYFSVPAQGPGIDPPFYFIRNDLVKGTCLAITGSISLLLGLCYWKKHPLYARMAVWMSILFSGGASVKSFVILIKTNNLFSPSSSKSSWLTFEEYTHDPSLWIAQFAPMIFACIIAFLTRNKTILAQADTSASRPKVDR